MNQKGLEKKTKRWKKGKEKQRAPGKQGSIEQTKKRREEEHKGSSIAKPCKWQRVIIWTSEFA